MKLPSSGFKVAIYIYTLYANGFPTVRSNKSREEKIHISFIFFLADSSAANSQNGGPGVCHFLVLVWASGVAGFSKMVSTPYSLANTLVLRWTPKSPAWEGLNGGEKNTSWMGVLGGSFGRPGTIVMLSRTSNEPSKHLFQFFFELYSIFPAALWPFVSPLWGGEEASKAATCGKELVPTWRIIPLGQV